MKLLLLAMLLGGPLWANDADPLDVDAKATYQDDRSSNRTKAQRIADDIAKGEGRLAARTDEAIAQIIKLGARTLRRKGFTADAYHLEDEYNGYFRGFLERMVKSQERKIGDHKPLSAYLAIAYEILELKLGLTLCSMLHLTDLKTLNYGIPVVFHACTFPMDAVTVPRKDEYRNHFAGDGRYAGLVPVISYWVVWGFCEAATWGAGWFFICSPLGTVCEIVMEKYIAPGLSDRIFDRVCN